MVCLNALHTTVGWKTEQQQAACRLQRSNVCCDEKRTNQIICINKSLTLFLSPSRTQQTSKTNCRSAGFNLLFDKWSILHFYYTSARTRRCCTSERHVERYLEQLCSAQETDVTKAAGTSTSTTIIVFVADVGNTPIHLPPSCTHAGQLDRHTKVL